MALCNARLRHERAGLRCRNRALANGRCHLHGGRNVGYMSPEGRKRSEAGRQAGFKAYVARMHEAKAMGFIDRFPWGVGSKGKGGQVRYRMKEAAMEIAEKTLARLPAAVDKPFDEQTLGEQLATVTRMSLRKAHEILALPCDPDDRKLMSIQKDTSLSLIATQVRVDESIMRRQSADRLPEMIRRIAEIKAESLRIDAIDIVIEEEDR